MNGSLSLAFVAAFGLIALCTGQMPDVPTGGFDKRVLSKAMAKLCDDNYMTDDRLQKFLACGEGKEQATNYFFACIFDIYGKKNTAQEQRQAICKNLMKLMEVKDCVENKVDEDGGDMETIKETYRNTLPCLIQVLEVDMSADQPSK